MTGRHQCGGTIDCSEYGWTQWYIEITALVTIGRYNIFSEGDGQRGNGRPL